MNIRLFSGVISEADPITTDVLIKFLEMFPKKKLQFCIGKHEAVIHQVKFRDGTVYLSVKERHTQ